MLVITRRTEESLLLGEGVRVTVLGVRPDQVRLGIEAPREVSVVREELLEEVRRRNLEAARTPAEELRAGPLPGRALAELLEEVSRQIEALPRGPDADARLRRAAARLARRLLALAEGGP